MLAGLTVTDVHCDLVEMVEPRRESTSSAKACCIHWSPTHNPPRCIVYAEAYFDVNFWMRCRRH